MAADKIDKYVVSGRPKVRSMGISAGISLVGIALVWLAYTQRADLLLWVGFAMAGIGIGLVMSAQNAARKSSVTAQLNDLGFLLVSNRTQYGLPWEKVSKVVMRANELVIRDKGGEEVRVVAPPGSEPHELDNLAAAMAARLDASRGYRKS